MTWMARAAFAFLLLAWSGLALSQAYPITVKGEREGRGAVVRANNEGPIPVSVALTFTEFDNLASSERVPIVTVVPPNTVLDLTRLSAVDAKRGWSYKLRYRYRYGSDNAGADSAAASRAPRPGGRAFLLGPRPGRATPT